MDQLDFGSLLNGVKMLSALSQASKDPRFVHGNPLVTTVQAEELWRLQSHLQKCGLTVSAENLQRLIDFFKIGSSVTQIGEQVRTFDTVLHDEMKVKALVVFSGDAAKYNRSASDLFGEASVVKFVNAAEDMDEAAKCLAFGRATAAVFHLTAVQISG